MNLTTFATAVEMASFYMQELCAPNARSGTSAQSAIAPSQALIAAALK